MSVPKSRVLRLAAASERSLLESSFGREPSHLTDARLQQKIVRARTLRNKYRDLAKRQRLEARGKRDAQRRRPAQGNENTVLKATMFDEALERLQSEQERRAERATREEAWERERPSRKAGSTRGGVKRGAGPAAKRGTNPWAEGPKDSSARTRSSKSRGTRKRSAFERSGVLKSRKHAGARTRRTQAKRDSR